MVKSRASLLKIATIALAVSFFVEVLTVAGLVFLRGALTKMGIFIMMFKLHEYNGFLFIALVLLHIWFNRGWIRVNIIKKR